MNIVFIVPLNEPYDDVTRVDKTSFKDKVNRNIKKLYCVYPSGVLSISAYIKEHHPEINIKILDLNVFLNQIAQSKNFDEYKFEDLINEAMSLLGFTPDIIGISALFTSVYRDLIPLSSLLKNNYPDSLIVCGGHLASSLYERIYKEDDLDIDAIAFGEGEIPSLELVRAFLSGEKEEYLSSSPSWITKSKVSNGFVPKDNAIIDLDEIPPYDLSTLFFPDAYFDSSSFLFMPEIMNKDHKEMLMFTTRGCPFKCIFCASSQVHGKSVRSYTANRIKKNILFYNEKYGIDKFVFYDDHFLFKKDRTLEILDFISQKGFTASIINPAFFSIDEDIASAMKRAGVKSVILSLESGNENTLKNIIHKPSSSKRASEAVDFLHKKGINAATNIVIGLPGETKESIDSGIEYLLTTSFNWFNCFVVAPLPGSELYKICEENDYFTVDDPVLLMDFKKGLIRTKDFTPEYIEKKAYEMNLNLNYVNNPDIRSGNYSTALMLFERVIYSVVDTHAFAYYFAAKCCKMLSMDDKYLKYKTKYKEMIDKYTLWEEYASQFNLKDLD